MNHPARYTRPAMVMHWLTAVLVAAGAALGLGLERLPEAWVGPAIDLHKSIGITVLCLVLVRVPWRLAHAAPPAPAGRSRLERLAARTAHLALYGLVLALPLSGWIHDSAFAFAARHPLRLFGVLPWPRLGIVETMAPDAKLRLHARWFAIHIALFYALCALSALHVAGVLKHHFADRDRPLRRMWS